MAVQVAELPRMHRRYIDEIVPALVAEFRYLNAMQVPSIEKVVVNIGLGEAITNARAIDAAIIDLKLITGQAPIVIRATKSVAAFKLREGMPIGIKVTLRGRRMCDFLDKLLNVALPAHPRLPRRRPEGVRRSRQLHPRVARATRLPGDRLRQDRQASRAGGVHRDDRPHRRRGPFAAHRARDALQEELTDG